MGYLPTSVEESTTKDYTKEKYKDFYYDESTHSFTGQIVDGVSALKGWIFFALKIARYRYVIYSWKYGSELETIISTTFDDEEYMNSEIKRMIEDALLINPYIDSVEDVVADKVDETLSITCTVKTKYGDIYVKV